MTDTSIKWMGVAGLLIIWGLGVVVSKARIENDLTLQATQALADAGVEGARIQFGGRDGVLVGTVPERTMVAQATQTVQTIRGVRVVRNRLTVAEPTDPIAYYELDVRREEIVLNGVVTDADEADRLLTTLTTLFPRRMVIDNLHVNHEMQEADWWLPAGGMLQVLRELEEAQFGVKGDMVHLQGEALRGRLANMQQLAQGSMPDEYTLTLALEEAMPPDPERVAQAQGLEAELAALLGEDSVAFNSGSAGLTIEGQAVLDDVAGILRRQPGIPVEIQGHTDNSGATDMNEQLSRRRAEAVRDYLVAHGVDEDRLSTVGFGPHRPLVDNATPEGRRRNRRIAFRPLLH